MNPYFKTLIRKEMFKMFVELAVVFYFKKVWPVLVLVFLWRSHIKKIKRVIQGYEGEEEVFKRLKRMKITTLQNYDTGYGDIDFLLIGKFGVIVLEVKKFKRVVEIKGDKAIYRGKNLFEQLDRNSQFIKGLLADYGIFVPVKSFLIILGKVNGKHKRILPRVEDLKKFTKGNINKKIQEKILSALE